MPEAFLPFCRPQITDDDVAAVNAVLRSGWITTGAQCSALEAAFCSELGARFAVSAISATALLHLYLVAQGIGPGDEVITPSLTWVSTPNLVQLVGATPVFVDVDRDNLMTTAALIERAITPRTRLIIPVHFAGAPLDIEPIRALARERNILLLEDAAHAFGSISRGEAVGSRGDAIFSLQAIKNVTSAEGGVFVTGNEALAAHIRRLRFHGLGVDSFDRTTQGRSPQAEVVEPGFKYNLPDLCAALGLNQFKRLAQINGKRAELAAYYRERLREVPELLPLVPPPWPHTHGWHLMVVRVLARDGTFRNEFIEKMKAEQIGCGIHFRAVHEQKFYREHYRDALANHSQWLANTEWNSARICSLPFFPDMKLADVDRVINAAKKVLASA
jgi:UDP-4-amino-4-deoxy-L-arabinose-oxoglutarate aminotransferase